jgi:dihydrolipoamide dehydrogenase
MSPTSEQTELLVIGAGPGGYVCAIRAAQHDIDVTLVDGDSIGGTCLNYGCIPSKALISATERVDSVANAAEMGIYSDPYVDVPELFEWKDTVVEKLTTGVESLCKHNDVTVIEGYADFEDTETARVETDDGAIEISFDSAVIATGSEPIELDGFDVGDDPVLDSRQALELSDAPESMVVIGAGYIGMELGSMFQKLGVDVTVVEMLDTVLPQYDSELAEVVETQAIEEGIELQFGEAAQGWSRDGNRVTVRTRNDDGAEFEYSCDTVLVAPGRTPVTDTLTLDNIGLEPDEDGYLSTDTTGETNCPGIYAVGDVAGEPMLAHKASMEGVIVAETVAGKETTVDQRVIPAVVFTDPEIATVGVTPEEAKEDGIEPAVGRLPLSANGRALSLGEPDGFVRLVADSDTGRLVGAAIVGPEASELIAEPTLAIQHGLTVEEVAMTVHAHPTLSEAIMEGADDVFGTPIHWNGS